jgi:hypothetical protein
MRFLWCLRRGVMGVLVSLSWEPNHIRLTYMADRWA